MNRDLLPELRILTGTHAGARALLGEGPHILGSDADCDFILSDEGIAPTHVRVECDPDGGALLYWLNREEESSQRLGRGEKAIVGTVTITVDDAGADWPNEMPPIPVMSTSEDVGGETPLTSDAPWALPADSKPIKANAFERRLDWRALAAFAAIALASLSSLWWALRESPVSDEGVAAVPLTSTATADAQKAEILAIVGQLGMANRVTVVSARNDAGRLEVQAHVLTDSEAEILAIALAGLTPRPSLRLANEQEVTFAVEEAVKRHADRLQTRLTVRHIGGGHFRIEGSVIDLTQKKTLLNAISAEFPHLPAFQDGLRSKTELAHVMIQELRNQGIRDIESSWQDGMLALKVRISATDVPRWEQALREVANRYDIPFKASLDLSGNPTPMIVALPLRIRSVVSGDVPYLVLANGERLFVDGWHDGWRLVSVDSQSVVFEGPKARRVAVNR